MNEDRYVAAIEISSSKIIAVVGKIRPSRELDIIACEQEKGVESVRYGVIQNLEETSLRLQRVIDKLQHRPGVTPRIIKSVFVGLSGRSLRTISTTVSRNLPEETEITDEILASLRADALSTAIDSSLEVIDAIPRTFTVGKTETSSPKGALGNRISAVYDLIVCRPEMKRNLMRVLSDKLHLKINGAIVTALSTSQLILTPEEKRLGCMLVDMGAETTTVTIFKGGHLKYFATLPLGGRNITRDITSISILEERAEDLKKSSADAIARDSASGLNFNGINMSDISNLVVARSEEIVANIIEQISYANLTEKDLPGGIICIGGGSQLRGMIELLSNQSGMLVRKGQLPNYVHIDDPNISAFDIIEVASVLYTGATNTDAQCLEMPQHQELPVTGTANPEPEPKGLQEKEYTEDKKRKKNGFFSKFGRTITDFFAPDGEDDNDLMD